MAEYKLYLLAKGTPLLEKGYKGVFEGLPEEKQSELIMRKATLQKRQRYIYNVVFVRKMER